LVSLNLWRGNPQNLLPTTYSFGVMFNDSSGFAIVSGRR